MRNYLPKFWIAVCKWIFVFITEKKEDNFCPLPDVYAVWLIKFIQRTRHKQKWLSAHLPSHDDCNIGVFIHPTRLCNFSGRWWWCSDMFFAGSRWERSPTQKERKRIGKRKKPSHSVDGICLSWLVDKRPCTTVANIWASHRTGWIQVPGLHPSTLVSTYAPDRVSQVCFRHQQNDRHFLSFFRKNVQQLYLLTLPQLHWNETTFYIFFFVIFHIWEFSWKNVEVECTHIWTNGLEANICVDSSLRTL